MTLYSMPLSYGKYLSGSGSDSKSWSKYVSLVFLSCFPLEALRFPMFNSSDIEIYS